MIIRASTNRYTTTSSSGRFIGFSLLAGMTGLLFLLWLVPVLLTSVSVVIRNEFRLQLIAYGVPEAIADDWAWGGDQRTYTVQVSQGSLPQIAGSRQLGGLRIFPGDLGVATQIIDGQNFGPDTRLGTGTGNFFLAAAPYAEQLHQLTGIPTSTVLAQWALETGYGQNLRGWNFGNQKDPGDPTGSTYMVFTSAEAGVRGEAQLLLNSPAYGSLVAQRDPLAAANAWGSSPWAQGQYRNGTDRPGTLLISLINTYGLQGYDSAPVAFSASSDIIKPLPTLPASAPQALKDRLAWATTNPAINLTYPNGDCEQFAEEFYGNGWHYPTAAAAEAGTYFHPGPASNAPIGALVYFVANDDNHMDGHVGIKLDADTMLATSPLGVKPISISFWAAHYAAVTGWRDPYQH